MPLLSFQNHSQSQVSLKLFYDVLKCKEKLKISLIDQDTKVGDIIERNHVIFHICCIYISYINYLVYAPSFKAIPTLNQI